MTRRTVRREAIKALTKMLLAWLGIYLSRKYEMTDSTTRNHHSFRRRLKSVFAVDCIRASRVLEIVEYSFMYAIIAIFVGALIDKFVAPLYPEKEDEKLNGYKILRVTLAVAFQATLSAVSVLYIRKIAQLVPFFFDVCPKGVYKEHYHVSEYGGEIALALAFIGVQSNLLDQVGRIRNWISGLPDG